MPQDQEEARPADTLFPDELRRELPGLGEAAEEVMAKLVGLGLAYDRAGITFGGLFHWGPTDFGRAVLAGLENEAE